MPAQTRAATASARDLIDGGLAVELDQHRSDRKRRDQRDREQDKQSPA